MEEDLIAGLTRQVKEEVIENYVTERRLIGYQIEDVEHLADEVRLRAYKTGKRLSRLSLLMVGPEMVERLMRHLNVGNGSYWSECVDEKFSRGIRFIRVRALTDRAKFRKLVLEAYNRLFTRMAKYRKAYENLSAECAAVNSNILHFQKNFDLLTILNFLKSLDTEVVDQKRFLGENFTAEELVSVDRKLYVKPIVFEALNVPQPLNFPKPEEAEPFLGDLAREIYQKYQQRVKTIML